MTAATLIEAFQENERDLFHFLNHRVRSIATAEDIIQDLYLKICDVSDHAETQNPRAYLYTMAANMAVDHQRRESRRATLRGEMAAYLTEPMDIATPERFTLARDELERLQSAMTALHPTNRRILYLSRIEGLSQREIAAAVGLSSTAVFKRLRMIMDHLAKAREG